MKKIVIIFIMLSSIFVKAQDDLLSLLGSHEPMYISSTFKDKKIVNGQSVELTSEGVLQFQIQHRFGTLNSGFYNLFGLDNSQIRLGFDYGIKDWVNLRVGRSSALKTIDLSTKVRIKRQSNINKRFPLTIVVNSSIFIKQYSLIEMEEESFVFSNQLSYAHQLLIARKINRDLSIQISPTFVHYNLVKYADNHDRTSLGLGARHKLNNRISVNIEYFIQRKKNMKHNVLSFGFDIETGGHVFQVHLSNSPAMIEPVFIHETTGDWADGDIYFGFNISRVFTIKKRNSQ